MAFATVAETAEELLIEFLEVAKQMLIDDLDSKGRNATGKTKKSIRVANITSTSGQLLGAEHILYTFQGRGPGKMPPLSQLIDWCSARGIPRSKAWIIAKNIAEFGTKLFRSGAKDNNVLLNATSKERIDELSEGLRKTYSLKLNSDLKDIINK